jgi:hypothetical protein
MFPVLIEMTNKEFEAGKAKLQTKISIAGKAIRLFMTIGGN